MTSERWQKIDRILDEVLELEAFERTKFLDKACAGDAELRSEIESLLAASEQSGNFIESPFLPTADAGNGDSISMAGQSVGPYRLLREIGHGGMGVVYLAVRADDEFKQQVAIKLVQPGPHNKDLLRRFRRERQILANLDHPNIARLFDGGTTEQGVPYLVMEYITGIPITEYCDERKLSITDRIKLYRDVCAAVQHAHQRLVIHRDLKPSNILVTATGEAKLLDFGIAKLLDADSNFVNSGATTGAPVMTPEYASPEQIRSEPVTTASDVYSLGIVLYELLTGHYPYRFKDRSLPEIIRVICEQEPEPPSRAISRIEITPPRDGKPQATVSPETVSRTREGKPEKLCARLHGDLTDIVLMALRKDLSHRYSTVEQLSEDIRRHLEGKVVFARKATFAYRSGKFIRRYKTGAVAAMILLLTLLGGIFATLRQAGIARREALDRHHLLYASRMMQAGQASNTTNIGRLRKLIDSQVPRDGEEDLRDFEWRYLWRTYNHNGELFRLQHDLEVWALAYSPDGKTLATGDDAGSLTLWDTATGGQVAKFKAHGKYIIDIKFSPDGNILATASEDKTVKLWNATTWQELATLRNHKERINVLAFSADGKRLVSGSTDLTAKIWDVSSRQNLITIDVGIEVNNFALSPDGKRLVFPYGPNGELGLWDAATGKKLRNLTGTSGEPKTFAPDGKLLVLNFGTISLLDVDTGQVSATFKGHSNLIHSIAFSPDGKLLASASADHTARIWDTASWARVSVLKGHDGEIFSVAFSPDGKSLATCGDDSTARLWDTAVASEFIRVNEGGSIYSLAFSPDCSTLACGLMGWAFTLLWDVNSGNQIAKLEGVASPGCVAFSPDGKRLAIGQGNGMVYLKDATTLQEITSIKAHADSLSCIMFSPDSRTLATASADRTAKLWDVDTGQIILDITEHKDRVTALTFSPDSGLLVTASYDLTEKLWDVKTGLEIATFKGHERQVMSLAISRDGNTLATGGADGIVKLWDISTRLEKVTFTEQEGHVNSVAFSPDSKRLATGSDEGLVRLWDVDTGQEVIALSGHSEAVMSVAFSPDGDTLVSGSVDNTIRFWRAASRQEAFAQK